jgi:hypothetical protein
MTDVHRAGVRAKLKARNEPYWRHVEGTGYIGYRKPISGTQTWQARWRSGDGKRLQQSFGRVTKANDFAAASQAARDWFNKCEQGVVRFHTVEDASRAYLRNMAEEKPDAVLYSRQILTKHVIGTSFGKRKLDKLLPDHVRTWRAGLVTDKRSKTTANRILTSFKAAMNFAYRDGMTTSNRAWSVVSRYSVETRQRDNFLTKQQAKILLDAAPGFTPIPRTVELSSISSF